jgi:hypothetical protein
VNHGTVELKRSRHIRLAAEDLYQALYAGHPVILSRQTGLDNGDFGLQRRTIGAS